MTQDSGRPTGEQPVPAAEDRGEDVPAREEPVRPDEDKMPAHEENPAAEQQSAATQRYLDAGRASMAEARKDGTPDYDPRAHERAVEFARRAAGDLQAKRVQTPRSDD